MHAYVVYYLLFQKLPKPRFSHFFAPEAVGAEPVLPTWAQSINTFTETTMFLRHKHRIHTPVNPQRGPTTPEQER